MVIAIAKHQLASLDSGGSPLIALACVTVGTIVVWHRPDHPMGWILSAARLKDTVDADSVTGDLAPVVQRALQPPSLSVWLRELGQRSELSSHLSVVTGVQAASLPSSRAGSSSVITSCR